MGIGRLDAPVAGHMFMTNRFLLTIACAVLPAGAVSLLLGCRKAPEPVFVPVANQAGGIDAQLETYVYLPAAAGKRPVVILNHGSSGGQPRQHVDWTKEAAYFTSRGYLVVAPMRRGRGKSSGVSLESEEKNCDLASWEPGLASALSDLDAVMQYVQALPRADARRITLVGVSAGGFLSIAYAAKGRHRESVSSVVNFVGGWVGQRQDQCPQDFNEVSFAKFGALAKVPTLWLYGRNDFFYTDESIQAYARAYRQAGGNIQFHLIDGVPKNGHWLPGFPRKWRPYVDAFLPEVSKEGRD